MNYGIKLTPRQWATYNFIKFIRETEGRAVSQKEICDNYPYDMFFRKDGYVWNENPKSHDHCSQVWQDIADINNNDQIHKIIISKVPYTYELAETEQEVREYAYNLYYKQAMAKLYRYGKMMRKVKRDGQGRLIFDENSKARDFWETFIKELNVDELVNLEVSENEKCN